MRSGVCFRIRCSRVGNVSWMRRCAAGPVCNMAVGSQSICESLQVSYMLAHCGCARLVCKTVHGTGSHSSGSWHCCRRRGRVASTCVFHAIAKLLPSHCPVLYWEMRGSSCRWQQGTSSFTLTCAAYGAHQCKPAISLLAPLGDGNGTDTGTAC
jgi:hypothetical protein